MRDLDSWHPPLSNHRLKTLDTLRQWPGNMGTLAGEGEHLDHNRLTGIAQIFANAPDRIVMSRDQAVNVLDRLRLQGHVIDLIAVMQQGPSTVQRARRDSAAVTIWSDLHLFVSLESDAYSGDSQ